MSISNPGPTTERKIWHLSFGDGLCLTWRLLPCVHTQHSPLQLEIAPLCSQTARTLFILLLMDPQVGFRDLATEMALQNPSCASVSAMRRSGVPWLRRSATAGSYGRAVSRYLRPPPHTDFCAGSLHSRQQRLLFVPIPASLSVICFLDDCRSDWGEMKSQYSFNLHLRWRGWLNICFSCLSAICILYLENSLQLHSPFIDWEVGRLVVEVFKLLWLLQM